jgi:hypothetical protein
LPVALAGVKVGLQHRHRSCGRYLDLRGTREQDEEKLYEEEPRDVYSSSDSIRLIPSRRMGWAE